MEQVHFSNYVTSLNRRLVLIDKKGNQHDIKDWISSKTYCCPDQPELCIADNNTDHYDKQNISNKKQMEYDAWAKLFMISDINKIKCKQKI